MSDKQHTEVGISANDIKKLFANPNGHGYAFAGWRMPGDSERHFIVSMSEPTQGPAKLEDFETGFTINKFAQQHPTKPIQIKADLVLKENGSVYIDPRVQAKQLDQFKEKLHSSNRIVPNAAFQATSKSDGFEGMVSKAIGKIESGAFEKVVLSRYTDVELPPNFSAKEFFDQLCSTYPNAFCSIVFLPGEGIWVGASPELLVSETKDSFKTISLAGTKKLEEGQSPSEIAWTQKEIEEQALVSRYIVNCFKKIRLREFHERGPKTVKSGNLAHLMTEFIVDYKEVSFDGLADQMLDLLHPTSAVCGMPLDTAKSFIEAEEGYDRSYYSGFLGPVNYEHSTDLFVNLRCMNIKGNMARIYAGAGITHDSIPGKELEETQLKMDILRRLI